MWALKTQIACIYLELNMEFRYGLVIPYVCNLTKKAIKMLAFSLDKRNQEKK